MITYRKRVMMMEDCKYIQDLLPFYLDNDVLTEAERKTIDMHIAHCEACSKELQDMQQNASVLHWMGRTIFQAPNSLSLNVMEQIHAENSHSGLMEAQKMGKKGKNKWAFSHPYRWVGGIAAAFLLAATVVGGVSLLSPSDVSVLQIAENENSGEEIKENIMIDDFEISVQEETVIEENNMAVPPMEQTKEESIVLALPTEEQTNEVKSEFFEEVIPEEVIPEETDPLEVIDNHLEPSNLNNNATAVLLNQDDKIRSTLLKMSFTDMETAVAQLQMFVDDCEGKIVSTTISSDSNCEIFSIQIPREQADNFIVSVTSSGFVLSQEQDFKTSLYSQLMEEYLQLQAQLGSSSTSDEISIQLKTQLAEVEQQMVTAQQDVQYESVVIWIQLTE